MLGHITNIHGEVRSVLPAFFVCPSRDIVVHSPLRHLKQFCAELVRHVARNEMCVQDVF